MGRIQRWVSNYEASARQLPVHFRSLMQFGPQVRGTVGRYEDSGFATSLWPKARKIHHA
jgi:hypothetical protein